MLLMDEILEKLGLKYESLNTSEQETLNKWVSSLESSAVTIPSIRNYISEMRDSVIDELSNTSNGNKNDLFLKARLKNYTLLMAMLDSPEKAKEELEKQLSGLMR